MIYIVKNIMLFVCLFSTCVVAQTERSNIHFECIGGPKSDIQSNDLKYFYKDDIQGNEYGVGVDKIIYKLNLSTDEFEPWVDISSIYPSSLLTTDNWRTIWRYHKEKLIIAFVDKNRLISQKFKKNYKIDKWKVTNNDGLIEVNLKRGNAKVILGYKKMAENFLKYPISDIEISDDEEKLFISTKGNGLYSLEINKKKINIYNKLNSLVCDNYLNDIELGEDGSIYLSTDSSGLQVLNNDLTKIHSAYNLKNYSMSNCVVMYKAVSNNEGYLITSQKGKQFYYRKGDSLKECSYKSNPLYAYTITYASVNIDGLLMTDAKTIYNTNILLFDKSRLLKTMSNAGNSKLDNKFISGIYSVSDGFYIFSPSRSNKTYAEESVKLKFCSRMKVYLK